MSYVTLPYKEEWDFLTLLDANMALIQKLVNMTLCYKNVKVVRLSYVDYDNKRFFPNFPLEKRLCIHNTSTIDKFGYGKYAGNFFDVILRLEDGNPINYRLFYGIEEDINSTHAEEVKSNQPDVGVSDGETMFILGENRKIMKKGRFTYVSYGDKYISLTEARKVEKRKSSVS